MTQLNVFPDINPTNIDLEVSAIRLWAEERGIFEKGTVSGQLDKLYEEFQELEVAYNNDDDKTVDDMADAVGDMTVVLVILADLMGISFGECLYRAYSQIRNRKGKMVNGVFVKEA